MTGGHEAFQDLWGRWEPWSPATVLERLGVAPFPWWVAGGWAVEAAGAPPRPHDDTDVVVLVRDLEALRAQLADHHVWEASDGSLRPLLPGKRLSPGCEQLWVRRNAASPWVVDVLLTPADGDEWIFKRDGRVRRPLERAGWVGPDGVPYLAPEVVLLFKAKARRPKDEADFRALVPGLDGGARRWLLDALALVHPDHPWLAVLGG